MSDKSTVSSKPEASNYDRLDQLVRRFERIFNILVPVVAIVVSLLVVSIFIVVQRGSPLEAYAALAKSSFGGLYAIGKGEALRHYVHENVQEEQQPAPDIPKAIAKG